MCNSFRKRLWTSYFDGANVGLHTMKPLRHWFHVELICPIISRLFEVSIYVYASSYTAMDEDREVSHTKFTTVYLYRPDKAGVMTMVRPVDVLRPHSDRCLLLYHSPGGAHFMQAELKPGPLSKLVTSNLPMDSNTIKETNTDNDLNEHTNDDQLQQKQPSKRRGIVEMHAPTLLSPTLDKHANKISRNEQTYFLHEEMTIEGHKLVTWRNDEEDKVDISADDFYELVVLMKTPRCEMFCNQFKSLLAKVYQQIRYN